MTKSIELKYYDQKEVWKGYDNNVTEIKRAKKVINLIPDDVKSVLDIGCGNGIVTNMIRKSFVVGLDFAKIPLSQVKTSVIQASIDRLPIKSKKFDLIILTEVLEHLDDEIYIKAIEEIKRLKANYLLITVPYNENVELGLCKCSVCGNLFNASHHYRKFDNSWFNREFSEYGLEKIEYASYGTPPNEKLVKLKYKFDVYSYSDVAVCNKCGNRPIRPNKILRYLFSGLNVPDTAIKRMFKIQMPYHQMVLLRRRNSVSKGDGTK
jgi:2-polyprenyl-3-methyl-5-hydroxy-6-metoxy-1,4-benzoquinol methylase